VLPDDVLEDLGAQRAVVLRGRVRVLGDHRAGDGAVAAAAGAVDLAAVVRRPCPPQSALDEHLPDGVERAQYRLEEARALTRLGRKEEAAALGGAVLMGLTAGILEPAGVDVERVFEWVVPSGAAGAVVVAAWLVESKQRVVENMAPVLTMLFTPLFAVMLAVSAVVYAVTGLGDAFDRDLVSVFDALLVVVLALVLYGMSARDPSESPGWMDRIQLVAVVSALVLDVMVLGAMIARIGDLGFTPNRTAALGLNLVLLVNLAGAAWLSARFLTGRSRLHRLERWQTTYLPVFALWAATVVVVLPLLFGFS
jgi:hypothetical protein